MDVYTQEWIVEDIGRWGINHVSFKITPDYDIYDYGNDIIMQYQSGPAMLRDPLNGYLYEILLDALVDYYTNKIIMIEETV